MNSYAFELFQIGNFGFQRVVVIIVSRCQNNEACVDMLGIAVRIDGKSPCSLVRGPVGMGYFMAILDLFVDTMFLFSNFFSTTLDSVEPYLVSSGMKRKRDWFLGWNVQQPTLPHTCKWIARPQYISIDSKAYDQISIFSNPQKHNPNFSNEILHEISGLARGSYLQGNPKVYRSESDRTPGYLNRSQVPPIRSRASRIV